MKDINDRFDQLENKLIEQEHRLLPIIRNVLKYGFDRSDNQKFKASWGPLLSYILKRQTLTLTIALTSGLTALIACYLAYQSNNIIRDQNELLKDQNVKVDQQNYLIEAERRSNLVFLFSNIMDKLDQELKEDYNNNGIRDVSPQLIGRISSLTQRLEPYRQFNKATEPGRLSEVSPERSQLFINIIESDIESETLAKIFKKSNFDNISIANYSFPDNYKVNSVNINDSEFIRCSIDKVQKSLFNNVLFEDDYFTTEFKNCSLDSSKIINHSLAQFEYNGGRVTNSHFDIRSKQPFPSNLTFIDCRLDSVQIIGENYGFISNGIVAKDVSFLGSAPYVRMFNSLILSCPKNDVKMVASKLSNTWLPECQFSSFENIHHIKKIPIGDSLYSDRYKAVLVNPQIFYITIPDTLSLEKEAAEILNHLLYHGIHIDHRYYLKNRKRLIDYVSDRFPKSASELLISSIDSYLNIDVAIWYYVQGLHYDQSDQAKKIFAMLDNLRINDYPFYREFVVSSYYRQMLNLLKENATLANHQVTANVLGMYIKLNNIKIDSNIITNRFDAINTNFKYVKKVDSIYFPGFKNRVPDHMILYPLEYDERTGNYSSKGFNLPE